MKGMQKMLRITFKYCRLSNLYNVWEPPVTLPARKFLESACVSFQYIAQLLGQPPINFISFNDPSEIVLGTILEKFVRVAAKIDRSQNFFKAMFDATKMQFPRDINILKEAKNLFAKIINTNSINYSQSIRTFLRSILGVLASSSILGYKDPEMLQGTAIELASNSPKNLKKNCFDMYYNINMILQLADNKESRGNIEMLSDFYQLVSGTIKQNDLAEISFVMLHLSNMSQEYATIFGSTFVDVINCFHGESDIKQVNFAGLLSRIESALPPGFRLRALTRTDENKFIFERSPFIVNQSLITSKEQMEANMNEYTMKAFTASNLDISSYFPSPLDHSNHSEIDDKNESEYESLNDMDRFIDPRSVIYEMHGLANPFEPLPLSFQKISSLSDSTNDFGKRMPKNMYTESEHGFISLKVTGFRNKQFIASIYIITSNDLTAQTQPIFIGLIDELPIIFNTKATSAVIQLPRSDEKVILVARIWEKKGKYVHNIGVSAIRLFASDGSFILNPTFPQRFHAVTNSTFCNDSNISQLIDKNPITFLPIEMKLQIKWERTRQSNVSRMWSQISNSTLFVPSIKKPICFHPPLITLTNIRLVEAKQIPAIQVYFKAYLIPKQTNYRKPKGLKCAIGFDRINKSHYKSATVPASRYIAFPDVVQFVIDQSLPPTAHILIIVYTINQRGVATQFKFSKLRIFENGALPSSAEIDSSMLKFDKCSPSNYLDYGKESSSRFKYTFGFPTHFCFPSSLRPVFNDGGESMMIDLKGSDPIFYEPVIPSIVFRYLSNISEISCANLIQFLALFDQRRISDGITDWIFGCFDSRQLSNSFLIDFMTSYRNVVKNCLNIQNGKEYVLIRINTVKTIPYIMNLISVTMAQYSSIQSLSKLKGFSTLVEEIGMAISQIILETATLKMTQAANKAYCQWLFFCSGSIPPDLLTKLVIGHFKAFESENIYPFSLQPLFKTGQADPFKKPDLIDEPYYVISIYYWSDIFLAFGSSPLILAMIMRTKSKSGIVNKLLQMSENAFKNENEQLVEMTLETLNQLIITPETYDSLAEEAATAFLPYLEFGSKVSSSPLLRTNPRIYKAFLLPILFVTHHAEKTRTQQAFSKLIAEKKINYISELFLNPILNETDTNIIKELAARGIEFVHDLVKVDQVGSWYYLIGIMVGLLPTVRDLCIQRSVTQMMVILMEKKRNMAFKENSEVFNLAAKNIINLIKSKMPESRALAISFFITYIKEDLEYSHSCEISLQVFCDAFYEAVLKANKADLVVFKSALSMINDILSEVNQKSIQSVMSAMFTIIAKLSNMHYLDPIDRIKAIFKTSSILSWPSIRIIALNAISEIHKQNESWIPAEACKLAAAVIISRVLKMVLDFEGFDMGVPSFENTEHFNPLIFSKDSLNNSLKEAESLVRESGMIAITEKGYKCICKLIGETSSDSSQSIFAFPDSSSFKSKTNYYLTRRGGRDRVYVSHISELAVFATKVKLPSQFDINQGNDEFVVPLKPQCGIGDEFSHYSSSGGRYCIKTADVLPNIFGFSDVIDIKSVNEATKSQRTQKTSKASKKRSRK